MTIHRLVYNPLSPSTPITPFPPFRLSTLRLWDVGNWRSLESTDGQYDRTTMDGTITVAQQTAVVTLFFTLGEVPGWASTNAADPCMEICREPATLPTCARLMTLLRRSTLLRRRAILVGCRLGLRRAHGPVKLYPVTSSVCEALHCSEKWAHGNAPFFVRTLF